MSAKATPVSKEKERSGSATSSTSSFVTTESSEHASPQKQKGSSHHTSKIPLDGNVFYNEETLKYMRIIDMYKKLGVGKDIELPRLVIAGAQSCGKSSLLENLTGLPVPITTGIGTRFPIEITLIEDEKKFQIKPSIILDPKAAALSSADMERMQKFNLSQVFNEPMTQIQFEEVLCEASKLFGVPAPLFARDQAANLISVETPTRQISSHVLQLEMRGPNFKSLSFVDTPGLYFSANSEQDASSIADIERLVVSLIQESRTVIVAVMEASQATVGQKIFKFANDVDVSGGRTLGVMTKCDLASTLGTDAFEATLCRAKKQERVLNHGWYVVKNRSSTEAKAGISLAAARQKEVSLFASPGWNPASSGLDPTRMGISALRTGLSNVFCAHIRAEFPAFKRQTRNILAEKHRSLDKLGPDRSSLEKQRSYLKSIVAKYQTYKKLCLTDNLRPYANTDDPSLLVRKLNSLKKEKLRDALKTDGAVYRFQTASMDFDILSDTAASSTHHVIGRNIYSWINARYQSTKSCSIPGMVPPELIERLFEEQTTRWKRITTDFVDHIQRLFVDAVVYCLECACPNALVQNALKTLAMSEIEQKIVHFQTYCNDLVRTEQDGLQLIAGEEQFVHEVRKARTARFISALARLEGEPCLSALSANGNTTSTAQPSIFSSKPFGGFGSNSTAPTPGSGATPSLFSKSAVEPNAALPTKGLFSHPAMPTPDAKSPALAHSPSPAPNGAPQQSFTTIASFAKNNWWRLQEVLTDDRQIVYEIHDILKAYYGTSVQHYTDTVCKNGLKKSFVSEVMEVVSEGFVDALSDAEVGRIAAESVQDRKSRRELNEDIERLECAIKESERIMDEGRE